MTGDNAYMRRQIVGQWIKANFLIDVAETSDMAISNLLVSLLAWAGVNEGEHVGHAHDTPAGQLACDTLRRLGMITGLAGAVVLIDEPADDGSGADVEAVPNVSLRGNMTDAANMVRAMTEMAALQGRPQSCPCCQANYDRLMQARAVMGRTTGSC